MRKIRLSFRVQGSITFKKSNLTIATVNADDDSINAIGFDKLLRTGYYSDRELTDAQYSLISVLFRDYVNVHVPFVPLLSVKVEVPNGYGDAYIELTLTEEGYMKFQQAPRHAKVYGTYKDNRGYSMWVSGCDAEIKVYKEEITDNIIE